ncbi:Putative membrane protein [Yersinia enterocolitica]|nr:Putative membrane protein [Yersinia enterocolitica]
MMSTMPVVGQLFGVIMVIDGVNTIDKNVSKLLGDNETEGLVADGFIRSAEFLGFERNPALATYTAISLGANVYSIYGLAFRSNSWKLFYTMRGDFVRKVDNMSMPKLSIKMVGYGLKAKVIIELMSTDSIN